MVRKIQNLDDKQKARCKKSSYYKYVCQSNVSTNISFESAIKVGVKGVNSYIIATPQLMKG